MGSSGRTTLMRTGDRGLMWHGMFLFLIALGAIRDHVELPPSVEKAARWSALYGTYGNWLFTTLGAAMGTTAANPILSQGHQRKPWQERVAGAGFRSIAYSILVAVVLILWGLGRRRPVPDIVAAARDDNGFVAAAEQVRGEHAAGRRRN